MKTGLAIASGILLAAFAIAVPAEAKTKAQCLAQWKEMKAAGKTVGMHYTDFKKQCMAGDAAAAAAAPPPGSDAKPMAADAKPMVAADAKPMAAPPAPADVKPMTPKRKAYLARKRACGAEWKADKAAGKVAAGMKWPQYWSDCNKRKKAEKAQGT